MTLTYDPAVEVVGQHPLTNGHQQPEGLLLFGVKQQHRRQDVHGLDGGKTTTVVRKRADTDKHERSEAFRTVDSHLKPVALD